MPLGAIASGVASSQISQVAKQSVAQAITNTPGSEKARLFDAFSRVNGPAQAFIAAGLGTAAFGAIARPLAQLAVMPPFIRQTYHTRQKLPGGIMAPWMEKRIQSDPAFRRHMEQRLGGRILNDGRNDGRVTVQRQRWAPNPFLSPFNQAGNFLSRLTRGMNAAVGALLGGLGGLPVGGGMFGPPRLPSPTGGGGPTDKADISSIVNNPNLSIEEKMAMALMKMAEHEEKKAEEQLRKMDGGGQKKGPFSFLGGLGGPLGSMLGAGKGGVFGGLMGGMMGQAVGGLLGGGAQSMLGGGKSKESEQVGAQKLQMIQQKMERLFSTLSNVMKSFHNSSMASIRNIR